MVPKPNLLVYVVVGVVFIATFNLAVISAVARMWATALGAVFVLAVLGAFVALLDEAGRRRDG